LRVYNEIYDDYDSEEERMRVAWSAVREHYEQDEEGNWVAKSDEYKVLKSNDFLNYTLGVAMPVGEEDSQGDIPQEEDVQKAAWNYMRKLQNKEECDYQKFAKEFLEKVVEVIESDEDVKIDADKLVKYQKELKSRVGDMHSDFSEDNGEVVESFVLPHDMTIGGEKLKKGSWLLGVVWNDEIFEKILKGERTGLSVGGQGVRIPE